MSNRLELRKLFDARPVAGFGGAALSGIIDLRRFARIEAVWLKAASLGTVNVVLSWQASPVEGSTANVDFQPFADNPNLLTLTTAAVYSVAPFPTALGPFVRFLAAGLIGNDAGTTVTGYVYIRETFD